MRVYYNIALHVCAYGRKTDIRAITLPCVGLHHQHIQASRNKIPRRPNQDTHDKISVIPPAYWSRSSAVITVYTPGHLITIKIGARDFMLTTSAIWLSANNDLWSYIIVERTFVQHQEIATQNWNNLIKFAKTTLFLDQFSLALQEVHWTYSSVV